MPSPSTFNRSVNQSVNLYMFEKRFYVFIICRIKRVTICCNNIVGVGRKIRRQLPCKKAVTTCYEYFHIFIILSNVFDNLILDSCSLRNLLYPLWDIFSQIAGFFKRYFAFCVNSSIVEKVIISLLIL